MQMMQNTDIWACRRVRWNHPWNLSFDCTYKRVAPGAPPSVKRDRCWLLNLSPPSNPTASAGPSVRPSIHPSIHPSMGPPFGQRY